jgi:hypothetical protein
MRSVANAHRSPRHYVIIQRFVGPSITLPLLRVISAIYQYCSDFSNFTFRTVGRHRYTAFGSIDGIVNLILNIMITDI